MFDIWVSRKENEKEIEFLLRIFGLKAKFVKNIIIIMYITCWEKYFKNVFFPFLLLRLLPTIKNVISKKNFFYYF